MILNCSCAHAAQDATHGSGLRVHTQAGSKGARDSGTLKARCTVCSAEKNVSVPKTARVALKRKK